MRATTFNHVSIRARSLAASLWFYTEIFRMERIPSPVFRHFALNVDDFEAVYVKAMALGIEDRETWSSHIYELPDWPDVTTLDSSVVTDIPKLADDVPQTEDAVNATRFAS